LTFRLQGIASRETISSVTGWQLGSMLVVGVMAVHCGRGDGDPPSDDGAGASASGAGGESGVGAGSTTGPTGGAGPSGPGAVLFEDDFEGTLDGWDDKGGEADKYVITSDPALVYADNGALDITVRSDWNGGSLNKWFTSVDEIHISMQMKFAADWNQQGVSSRHLMQLSGNHENVMQWGPFPDSSFGQAGVTPDGSDFFWIHLTPWNDDVWHVGMAHPGQMSMWGDSIMGTQSTTPGTYQHVVLHSRLNDLGASNGFVRLTIDGVVAMERTDMLFRTVDEIVFNSAGFQAYYNDFAGTSHVYVDDLIVREGAPF
jgi:hypothetical protein